MAPGKRARTDDLPPRRGEPGAVVPQLMHPAADRAGGDDDPFWFAHGRDARSVEEKQADLDDALAQAEAIAQAPGATVEELAPELARLRDEHGLRTLELIDDGGAQALYGEVNPKAKRKAIVLTKAEEEQLAAVALEVTAALRAGGVARDLTLRALDARIRAAFAGKLEHNSVATELARIASALPAAPAPAAADDDERPRKQPRASGENPKAAADKAAGKAGAAAAALALDDELDDELGDDFGEGELDGEGEGEGEYNGEGEGEYDGEGDDDEAASGKASGKQPGEDAYALLVSGLATLKPNEAAPPQFAAWVLPAIQYASADPKLLTDLYAALEGHVLADQAPAPAAAKDAASGSKAPRPLWFKYPARGTGDIWHAAACMFVMQEWAPSAARVIVGYGRKTKGCRRDTAAALAKAKGNADQLAATIAAVKAADKAAARAAAESGDGPPAKQLNQETANLPELITFVKAVGLEEQFLFEQVPERQRPNGKLKVIADRIAQLARGEKIVVDAVDQKMTTTILMEYVASQGVSAVVEVLRRRFTAGATDEEVLWVETRIAQIESRLAEFRAASEDPKARMLLINRRSGHENKQHNTTDALLEQFETAAAEHGMASMGVATGVAPRKGAVDIDLFDMGPDAAKEPKGNTNEKRRTALLWARIAELQAQGSIHGVVGGRSGSMDIAAFMGVNAFSWDEDPGDAPDDNYLRLLQSHPIMSIGHLAPAGGAPAAAAADVDDDAEGSDADEEADGGAEPAADRLVDPKAVEAWMGGARVHPDLPKLGKISGPLESEAHPMTWLRDPKRAQAAERPAIVPLSGDKPKASGSSSAAAAGNAVFAPPPANATVGTRNQFARPAESVGCSPMALLAIGRLLQHGQLNPAGVDQILTDGGAIYGQVHRDANAAAARLRRYMQRIRARIPPDLMAQNLRHLSPYDVVQSPAYQGGGIAGTGLVAGAGRTFVDGNVDDAMAYVTQRFQAAGDRGVTIVTGGYTVSITRQGAAYHYFDSHGDHVIRNAFSQRYAAAELAQLTQRVTQALGTRVRARGDRSIGVATFERPAAPVPPPPIPAVANAAANGAPAAQPAPPPRDPQPVDKSGKDLKLDG